MTISDTLHPDALTVKYDVFKSWRTATTNWRASLAPWTTSRTSDGELMVSAEVRGQDAADALRRFAGAYSMFLEHRPDRHPEDLLPVLDVTDPDCLACVWRTDGVWVQLWHPDIRPAQGRPSRTVRRRRLLSAAGGRLPFTRKSRTPVKETSTV